MMQSVAAASIARRRGRWYVNGWLLGGSLIFAALWAAALCPNRSGTNHARQAVCAQALHVAYGMGRYAGRSGSRVDTV